MTSVHSAHDLDECGFILNEAIACLGESVDRVRALRERNFYAPESGSKVFNEWVLAQGKNAASLR
jgi:hypothetical protein